MTTARTGPGMTASLIDHLQEQGYEPLERLGDRTDDVYDLTASGTGTVRICLFPAGDGEDHTEIFAFDAFMCIEWDVRLSPGTPAGVVIATLEAAEWQLAEQRGGAR